MLIYSAGKMLIAFVRTRYASGVWTILYVRYKPAYFVQNVC